MNRFEQILEEGKKYIIPERLDEWVELCEISSVKEKDGARMLADILTAMRLLHENKLSYKEIEKAADSDWSGIAWSFLGNQVALLTPRGYDFVINVDILMSDERRKSLDEVNEENKNFPSQRTRKR